MARILGVDLPKNKRLIIALTYIYGIGATLSEEVVKKSGIDENTRVKDLSESEILSLRDILRQYVTEGDLRRQHSQSLKRLKDIRTYKGVRHSKGLPSRGQRTHTNARTRRGSKRVAIAGKKK